MDTPNAFIGKAVAPTEEELRAALGATADLWGQLIEWLAQQGVADNEWHSYSVKAGWALRLKVKKRTIVYLAPCAGSIRAVFVLGDKAVAAARQSDLSKATIKLLDEAPHYAEGTGVRLVVKALKDLAAIKKLATIKLPN